MGPINFSRTVNPLQFDALEPKRFEDLVRQLLYDLRPWRKLEPTGRAGSDDGFDARGWEVASAPAQMEETTEAEFPVDHDGGEDRLWLVQCKRERTITPAKLRGYLNSIAPDERSRLHGIIFVAATDFSKKSHDEMRSWCVESGIEEFYLWGKATLEDMLFQPKNDHLLFAYFGLSLTIRKRSIQATLRARTTMKRKLHRVIEDANFILVRDIEDQDYPFVPEAMQEDGTDAFRWWVCQQPKLTFAGLEFQLARYLAFVDDDGVHFDVANAINAQHRAPFDDPWRGHRRLGDDYSKAHAIWTDFPEANRAWVEVFGVIDLDDVIEVDEIGDDQTEHAHIYVRTPKGSTHAFSSDYGSLKPARAYGGEGINLQKRDRVVRFPAEFRKDLPDDEQDA